MKKVFWRFFIISCASATLAVNVFAAAAQDSQDSRVPSLQRLALQAIIKMERERGGRVPEGTLPHHLEQALEHERQLQQKAFKIIAYRKGFGAIGKLLYPVEADDRLYKFVYVHPNSVFFNRGMAVDQTYVSKKAYKKADRLAGALAGFDGHGGEHFTPDNTLFALSGDLLPQ